MKSLQLRFRFIMIGMVIAAAAGSVPQIATAQGTPLVVLDTMGLWRMRSTLEPPVIQMPDRLLTMDLSWTQGKRVLQKFLWASRPTEPAPKDWTAPAFDDTSWLRGPAQMACTTALMSQLCMRASFEVTDPEAAGNLQLSVAYRGGVIAYLNGKEVGRNDVAPTAAGKPVLARGYGAEAFATKAPEGVPGSGSRPLQESDAERALRVRQATITIPAKSLQKGANVLALEIVRAPYHQVIEERKGQGGSRYCPYVPVFSTCQIESVQLRSTTGRGIVSAAVRPKGFQVWNSSVLCADYNLDFGDAAPLRPIRIVAARNGRYSGKVVVGSTEPIRKLKAVAAPLISGDKMIPASAVRVRYGLPWGRESGVNGQRTIYRASVPEFNCYPRTPTMLGALADEAPEVIPVSEAPAGAPAAAAKTGMPALAGQPEVVFGAVAPVWVTVDVPKTAAAGLYKGQITIQAEGQEPRIAQIELEVMDYTLSDPQDYRTIMELIQSPDTLALEYKVKPWSQEHFDLIARSMRLMHEVGVPVVYVPLIGQTNLGNEESIVRWVKTGEGTYDWDFAVMDKYLDLWTEHVGQPRVVCFIAWDIYLGGAGGGYKDTWGHNQQSVELRKKYIGKGPAVTFLNRQTGEAKTDFLPPYDEPTMKAAWTKLFTELRSRMAKRGWDKKMMVGLLSDDWPTTAERVFYDEVTGAMPWVSHSHVPVTRDGKQADAGGIIVTAATAQGSAKVDRVGFRVGYHSAVLMDDFADRDPPLGSLGGWTRRDLGCYQPRYEYAQPCSRWREIMEFNITGFQRGISRGGADLWAAVRDREGRRVGTVEDRYPQSAWRNLDIPWCMFAPGPIGPASTNRYEALREGIQDCQARILIEEAMGDEAKKQKLGDDLAKRCEDLLVERTAYMLKAIGHLQINNQWGHITGPEQICRQDGVFGHRWFVGSGWENRTRQLYQLAGEVSRKLGGK